MSDPIFLSLEQVLYIQKAEASLTHSLGGFGFRLSEQGSDQGRLDPVF